MLSLLLLSRQQSVIFHPEFSYLQKNGLLTDYAANIMDNIQTVPKRKLGSLIASLSSERMEEVNRAIAFALGLDVPTFGL